MKYIYLSIVIVFFFSCKSDIKKTIDNKLHKNIEGNIFNDEILQEIYSLQNSRNTKELIRYFNNEYPEYRKAAVLALASVQDSMAIMSLSILMNDEDKKIRATVAYTLGQIKSSSSEQILIDAYKTEKSLLVKRNILEAIGKCGTDKGLKFICEQNFETKEIVSLTGQAWGLSRYGIRNIVSKQATEKIIQIISTPNISEKVRFIASVYLSRAKRVDLSMFSAQLIKAFNKEGYLYTRMNLASAFGKSKNKKSLNFLISILKSDYEYRIKINTIRALKNFNYESSSPVIYEQLKNKNINISYTASEYFYRYGKTNEANKYFGIARKLPNWRSRANMLAASLKYAHNKDLISKSIKSGYEVTNNEYEKASLLKALAGDPMNYKFVETQTFSTKSKVISTYGIEALAKMREHDSFDELHRNALQLKEINMYDDFALIFKKAIKSEDIAMIGIAAKVLRNPKFTYNSMYKNTYFLTQALHKCELPRDYEAYVELKETISYINGSENTSVPNIKRGSINWELVSSISPNQRVIIKTTKGDITIQLKVNEAPATVSNFIRLLRNQFYKKSVFHRVVPNFVIQDGCPRGDGWGGPNFMIRSEFPSLYYKEGSVGMASSGKDTESSQWFITLSPMPHLDGRYTIFGTVVDGMDVVHSIEIGDKILKFSLE